MPTVVDALVVTLGLDASSFKRESGVINVFLKDTREQATNTSKVLEERGKQGAEFFARIKREALGLASVLVGGYGLEGFVKNSITSLAALGRAATNMGVSVQQLAAFRNMIDRNGGSADAAAASFTTLANKMEEFKLYGRIDPTLQGGLNVIGETDKNASALDVYMKFVEYATAHRDDPRQVNAIGRLLGLDQDSINEALKGIEQVKKDLAESYKLGVPDPEIITAAQKLQKEWKGLEQASSHLGDVMLTDLEPPLSLVLLDLTGLVTHEPHVVEAITAIGAAFGGLFALRVFAATLGLKGVAGAMDIIIARLAQLGVLSLPLTLSGDTTPPEPGEHYDSNGPTLLGEQGPVQRWWREHRQSWMGPSATSIAPGDRDQLLGDATAGTPIPPALLGALVEQESGWDPGSVSDTGALGLTQVLPSTANAPGYGVTPVDPNSLADPATSLGFGARYLAARGGALGVTNWDDPAQVERALEAYYGSNDPAANRAYAASVLAKWATLRNSPGGTPVPHPHAPDRALTPSAGSRAPSRLNQLGQPTAASTNVTIGAVTVNTRATDAKGIARDFAGATTGAIIQQANRGLT
jgi:hypothetical protein